MGLLSDKPLPEGVQIFTTGQMIDALQYGEIAECLTGFYEGSKLVRTERDEIVFSDGHREFFKMTTFAHSAKWTIRKDGTKFMIGGSFVHENSNDECSECWESYPKSCECGGLVHSSLGDYTSEKGYYLLTSCDKCGVSDQISYEEE